MAQNCSIFPCTEVSLLLFFHVFIFFFSFECKISEEQRDIWRWNYFSASTDCGVKLRIITQSSLICFSFFFFMAACVVGEAVCVEVSCSCQTSRIMKQHPWLETSQLACCSRHFITWWKWNNTQKCARAAAIGAVGLHAAHVPGLQCWVPSLQHPQRCRTPP